MSLYKAIFYGKEHRHPYGEYKNGYFRSCVNHNPRWCQCPWCVGNRLHSFKVRELKAKYDAEYGLSQYNKMVKTIQG